MVAVGELPHWLPPLVRKHAQKFYAQAVASGREDELAMVRRITSDSRMRTVWRYLQNKRRLQYFRTAEYKNPVNDPMATADYHPKEFSTRAEWLQQAGLAAIYERAHTLGCLCLPSRLSEGDAHRRFPSEYENLPNIFRDQAATFRATAETWLNRCQQGKQQGLKRYCAALEKIISRIHVLAEDFEGLEKIWEENWKPAKLKPKDMVAAVTAQIARKFNDVLGEPMYGQTATIASLVLNVRVTREQARGHYHGVWGPGRKLRV
jgi:hypothetical protein